MRPCDIQEPGFGGKTGLAEPLYNILRMVAGKRRKNGNLLIQGDRGIFCMRKAAAGQQQGACSGIRRQYCPRFCKSLLGQQDSPAHIHTLRQYLSPMVQETS